MDWDKYRELCRLEYKKSSKIKERSPLPDREPTPNQLAFAKKLCIDLPEKCSRESLQILISNATRRNKKPVDTVPTQKQLNFAMELGIQCPDSLTKKQLSRQIDQKLIETFLAKKRETSSDSAA